MRCDDCGHSNPPSAKFCNECGARLAASAAAGAGASGLGVPERRPRDYTPRHLADRILTLRGSLEGERKVVTVLFADVVGSMSLSEAVGAERWHGILDRFFGLLGQSIHRFGGTINQFTGDGVMALFGAPIAHEDHAQRACQAALEIATALAPLERSLLSAYGLEFRARMGLNSGEVVVGKIGDDLRMDYTAQGHAVGLAARVERLARPGSVCLTSETADLVAGYFALADLGSHALPGSQEPVRVYELVGRGSLRTRLDVAAESGLSPFVGGQAVLSSLERALEQVASEGGLVVGLEGPAGIGKSRLAREFAERCRDRGIAVYRAHCPSFGRSVPLLPIRELLRGYFGIDEHDDAAAQAARIADAEILARVDLPDALPIALEALGLDSTPAAATARGVGQGARGIGELVCAIVRAHPGATLLVIDDLHWIDAESEAVLGGLVDAIAETRTLLLANFRPESRAPWMRAAHYRQLGLTGLAPEAQDELMSGLLGDDPSLHPLRDRVRDAGAGNPLFIEELIRGLAESGALSGSPGAYRLDDPGVELRIPVTLHSILAARIDRLPAIDKDVLQTAAVIGRRFDGSILERVAEPPEPAVAAAITALETACLIRPSSLHPRAPWLFHHALIRDVAYASLLTARREQLHAAVAQAICDEGDRLGERADLIAYHWEAANRPHEALGWRKRASLRVTNIQPRRRR